MKEYWDSRLRHAVTSSANAPNSDVRQMHMNLARHYEALRDICLLRSASKSDVRRLAA